MKITQLKTNQIERPMGYQMGKVSFSWKVEEAGAAKQQKHARIIVKQAQEILFDSKEDPHANSVCYPVQLALKPRTRYEWSVTVAADNGEGAANESWFETGKMEEPWQAQWISTGLGKDTPPIMEKEFEVEKIIKDARIYICGLGVYECYLNGKKVGEEYLAPGYHSYDFHLQVQTYDVADLLVKGKNQFMIMLGDGWFKGRLGFDGGFADIYGDSYYAISELHIDYVDGTREQIDTDGSFRCKQSPVTFSNIYDGEQFDASLEIGTNEDWEAVVIKKPANCGALTDRYSLPIVKKESFKPAAFIHTPKDEWVLDFGQNLTGWVEFDCELPIGTKITLTASEIMQNGCFYHDNFRTAKTEFTYIANGKSAHVRPHFTFYGFRYMKVECKESIAKDDFTAYHLRSDFDQIGFITTGSEKVNRLFANALWSQKDNFLDVPTDCPQRDERLGWTGDAQIFSDTACFNMYMPAFYRKYLWDMRAEQSILDGSVPNVVPRLKRGMVAEHGASPWADAGVIIPWNVYLHYGNQALLEETYPGMKAWVEYERRREEALQGPHLVKDGFHFADWLALDHEQPGPFGTTDPLYVASAYYYWCTKIVADASAILGYEEDTKTYTTLSNEILEAIQAAYFDQDGLCICGTQTGLALTVAFGLIKEQAENGRALLKKVADNQGHLNTGFVGTPILCPALTETGHHKAAMDLLLNEEYPGWLYAVNLGATTIWERWNSVLPDGTMNGEGMNSLNHYSYGSIAAWMYRDVCGMNPVQAAPGFKKASICPHPDERLRYAKARLETSAGRYICEWNYDDAGKVTYQMEIPFDTGALVQLPEGNYRINQEPQPECTFEIGSGTYTIIQE